MKRHARLAATAAALAIGTTPLLFTVGAGAAAPAAVTPRAAEADRPPLKLNLLAINDFHGQLEKLDATKTSSGRVATPNGNVNAGGGAFLATHLERLRAEAAYAGAKTVTVAAGDLIGATPLLSAAFHDEPTIEAMNEMGLDMVSVGNHEFDEGYKELLRMQYGGCLKDGPNGANNQNSCPDPDNKFTGADFQYLSANVKYKGTRKTVFPGYTVEAFGKKKNRVKVAFIGMTLEDTPNIVTKAGVEGLKFTNEVNTVDKLMPELRAQGIKSIVVLLHQGAVPTDGTHYNGCGAADGTAVTGPGLDIAQSLHPAVDVVISGHTHQAYNCVVEDPKGKPRLFTSAMSVGRLVTEVSLEINRKTGNVIRPTASAENIIVTNDDTVTPDDAIQALIAKYAALVEPIANKVLGHIAPTDQVNGVTKSADESGESPLGNLIADAQLADPSTVTGGVAPTMAFMNPGGIRQDLTENDNGEVTYGTAFAVQPFNNYLVSLSLTGQQIVDLLNEQWNDRNESTDQSKWKIMQVAGLSYTYDEARAAAPDADALVAGSVEVDTDGDGTADAPIDLGQTYRVVTNNFLADGGDGFATFSAGTDRYFGGLDIDAFASYLAAHDPYTPRPTDRIDSIPAAP